MTAIARTKPNSRNRRPAVLGRKEIGTKTETRVTVVATTAKKTCRVPSTAAARLPSAGPRRRWMFSSTTMESSTISPVASTSASRVSRLMEKPTSQIAATVPIRARGIATVGISVARSEPMKSQIVATTMVTAMDSVMATSRTEPRMKVASSAMVVISTSSKRSSRRSTARVTPSEMSRVFDLACRTMPRPRTRLPPSRT